MFPLVENNTKFYPKSDGVDTHISGKLLQLNLVFQNKVKSSKFN